MENKSWTRYKVEHAADDVAIEAWRRHLAVRWEPAVILRPKPVHHEREGPTVTLPIARAVGRAILPGLAVGRRPGQGQNVVIELAGLTLSTLLGEDSYREKQCEAESDRCRASQSITAMTTHHAPTPPRTNRKLTWLNGSVDRIPFS